MLRSWPGLLVLLASVNFIYAQQDTVRMYNYYFDPDTLRVAPEDTILWINMTSTIHTTTSGMNCEKDGRWNSGNMQKGEVYRHVFNKTGRFPYFCIPHCLSDMEGLIVVGTAAPKGSELAQVPQPFNSTRIINNHSVVTLEKGILDFRITHRFDDLAGARGGYHSLFGLDNIRDVRIGFDYGISDRFMAGIGRSKGDRFQPSVQQIRELYDLFLKYQVIKENNTIPVTVSLFANSVYSSMSKQVIASSEGNFNSFAERWSFSMQVLVAKVINRDLSLQFSSTYVRRNWAVAENTKNIYALGLAGRWMWSDLLGLVIEYNYLLNNNYRLNEQEILNSLGIGLEINTGGHVFHANFTNSTGINPNTFLPYTINSWTAGEFRFGFTISRIFNL